MKGVLCFLYWLSSVTKKGAYTNKSSKWGGFCGPFIPCWSFQVLLSGIFVNLLCLASTFQRQQGVGMRGAGSDFQEGREGTMRCSHCPALKQCRGYYWTTLGQVAFPTLLTTLVGCMTLSHRFPVFTYLFRPLNKYLL